MKLIIVLSAFLLVSCSHKNNVMVSSVFEETLLSEIYSKNESNLPDALLAVYETEIIEDLPILELGEFLFLYSKNTGRVYVVKDNKLIARHDVSGFSLLYNSEIAPLPNTESVIYHSERNSIAYRKDGYEYFDYGMDGLDAIYELSSVDNLAALIFQEENIVNAFYDNKECHSYTPEPSLRAFCCNTGNNVISGLILTKSKGWVKVSNKYNLKKDLDEYCAEYSKSVLD